MLETLILCMALDYLTGMMAAGIFHKSKKSVEGGLESRSGWKGLCRKGISLLIVLVSYRLDLIAGTDFICNAVMAAYLVNELLSITENLGLMGVPEPIRSQLIRQFALRRNRQPLMMLLCAQKIQIVAMAITLVS